MRAKGIRRFFDRQFFSDLIVFWFAVWIAWWFRWWFGHGPVDSPVLTSSAALPYYSLAVRTLVRSLMQSLLIACLALTAWRLFRHRTPENHRRP